MRKDDEYSTGKKNGKQLSFDSEIFFHHFQCVFFFGEGLRDVDSTFTNLREKANKKQTNKTHTHITNREMK